ncbi:hypothetical protein [Paenibacillus chitinolyticus]|uniref:Uncharacterized protein n=1 Tax=Paenibacillus chitinolyticus TaxID=79263 RepID=A0ABT4FM92_9BACL|nr:hypothetical protein [Paenibacillus chitinolyticus]MCY9593978.1 hypothetical protein [Paenibacillus chitinolyticus]MCY9599633.1 hypothetical protein [Paenibacillus chitinolyticus]
MGNIPEVICSESLTVDEYKIIMSKIWDSHRFGRLSKNRNRICRHIKYVCPNWDLRDGRCFSIGFDDVLFDFRGSYRSMFERIIGWLEGEEPECGGMLVQPK